MRCKVCGRRFSIWASSVAEATRKLAELHVCDSEEERS
jgi:hypothetical protein